MQHIQDKEFDQRLRDQFENEEIQLSANSWSDLERVLHPQSKRGTSYRSRWLAAASVLLLSSLGVYLSSHTGDTVTSKERLALNNPVREEQTSVLEHNEQLNAEGIKENIPNKPADRNVNSVTAVAVLKADSEKNNIEPELQAVSLTPEKDEIILSSLQPSSEIARHVDNQALYKPEKLAVLQVRNELPLDGDNGIEDTEQQRGIRNVGDLVNYVVDKVDKRAEKILKFKTDDDNSSLIAINIGMLKFNQKKQK